MNRRVREKDNYLGKMVGIGQHLAFSGVVEGFKAETLRDTKKRGVAVDQLSAIHLASRAFDVFLNAGECVVVRIEECGMWSVDFGEWIQWLTKHTRVSLETNPRPLSLIPLCVKKAPCATVVATWEAVAHPGNEKVGYRWKCVVEKTEVDGDF